MGASFLQRFLLIATLVWPLVGVTQIVDSQGKVINAFQVDEAPVIDGHLDDDAWAFGTVIQNLHQINPDEFDPPSEKSVIYVVYTKNALYLAGRFFDSEPEKVTAQVLRQGDFSFGDDSFTIMIDPFNNGRSGYAFDLTANGVRNQAVYANVTNENWRWTGIWHGAARRDDKGWIAEVEIPFKTLSFNPNNETWGLNVARWIGRKGEQIGWVSANRTQNPAVSGKLTGIRNIEQGLGLDVVPGIRTGQTKDYVLDETTTSTEPSLDVYFKLSPALTGALTINTDFSGTGADARQINLTRFGLFFPERRRFFLQDADIFEFGRITGGDYRSRSTISRVELESGRPFFSRRIGLSTMGETVDINIGGKLTGRPGRWDVGILAVRHDEFDLVDPSNLFVARLAANVLEESSVGMILTHGDPNSNLDNSLAGVDFRYTNTRLANGRTLEGAIWYQQTDTEGVARDQAAYGFSLRAPNAAGIRGALGFKELQENFNPALGFVNRLGVRDMTLEGGYTWYPQLSGIRTVHSGVDFQRIETTAGELQTQIVTLRPIEISGSSRDSINFHYFLIDEKLIAPFEISEGVIIPVGEYSFDQYCANLATAQFRKIAAEAYYCGGEFYDGTQTAAGVSIVLRPNKHFKISARFDFNDIDLPYGAFIIRLASLRADIAFTNAWYWENFLQYDNVSDSMGLNSILRYVPKAGREIVFVVNREYVDLAQDRTFTKVYSDLTFKFSYTLRF